jgi:hypothetical protein
VRLRVKYKRTIKQPEMGFNSEAISVRGKGRSGIEEASYLEIGQIWP